MNPPWLRLALVSVALGLAACASVLGIRPSNEHPFEHRRHLDKGIGCTTCHEGIATAGETGALHLPDTAKCTSCHQKPHDERTCNGCHGERYLREGAGQAREHLRFTHLKHVPVLKGNCARCHEAAGDDHPESLRPMMASCLSCHQHREQWNTRECDGCHVDLTGDRTPPSSHLVHDGDWLREHGTRAASARDLCSSCHTERTCLQCHGKTVPALPQRLGFDAPRMSGLHRAGFRSRHPEEARGNPALCLTCHAESSCRSCHEKEGVAPGTTGGRSPHPAGWISPTRGGGQHGHAARLDPVSCAACHGGAGEALCVGCHKVGGPGGTPHGPGFSSQKDKHRDAPCRMCHGATP